MSQRRFEVIEHVGPCQHVRQYARATSTVQEEVLEMKVKQYKPHDYLPQAGDVTILAAPAMSCPKEVYEPLWDALLDQQSRNSFRIRGIWSIDYSNQGASGVVNETKLGDEPSFFDWSRDLLLMVNQFRTEMPRPIVGFGHSLGALVMLDLALMHPRLMTSLVLIEPPLFPSMAGLTFATVYPMTFRKDTWPNKDAAMKALRKTPMYADWPPRALELLREYGLRDLPTATHPVNSPAAQRGDKVTLTSTKDQEVLSFARRAFPARRDQEVSSYVPPRSEDPEFPWMRKDPNVPFYRPEGPVTFSKLPQVRPACLYMYGEKSTWYYQSGNEGRRLKRETTGSGFGGSGGYAEGLVTDSVITGGSHYVPLEQPEAVGSKMATWLAAELRRVRKLDEEASAAVKSVAAENRGKVSEDWIWWTKHQYGGKKLEERSDMTKPKL